MFTQQILRQKVVYLAIFTFGLVNQGNTLAQSRVTKADPDVRVIDANSGDWIKVVVPELTSLDKESLIFKSYPDTMDFEVFLRFNGEAVLTGQPKTKTDKVFIFTIAGLKDNKKPIVLVSYVINVKGSDAGPRPDPTPGPTPIPPGPEPAPSGPFFEELSGHYRASPSKPALDNLVSIFAGLSTAISQDKITTQAALRDILQASAKEKLKDEDIKPLRAAIAKILATEIPPTETWVKSKASTCVTNVFLALRALQLSANSQSNQATPTEADHKRSAKLKVATDDRYGIPAEEAFNKNVPAIKYWSLMGQYSNN